MQLLHSGRAAVLDHDYVEGDGRGDALIGEDPRAGFTTFFCYGILGRVVGASSFFGKRSLMLRVCQANFLRASKLDLCWCFQPRQRFIVAADFVVRG